MAKIKAIRNHVIFKFEDSIAKKSDHGSTRRQFEEVTDWGFEMSSYDDGAKKPRWGIVVSVGHEVTCDVHVGSRILIEALQWTEAMEVEGVPYWRTDDYQIMALDENFQP